MSFFIFTMLMLTGSFLIFGGGYSNGKVNGEKEMRPKVVLYCIEKPDLCKEEYNNIKTQNKLNTYQKPEIE